jgi:hypothetical protein
MRRGIEAGSRRQEYRCKMLFAEHIGYLPFTFYFVLSDTPA